VARATLPQGTQVIEFQTGSGSYKKEINIGSRFSIIPIRITDGTVYVGQPNTLGTDLSELPEITEVQPAKPVPAAKKAPVKRPIKKLQ